MNAVEKLLYSTIQDDPRDWGARLDLGRRLGERGALAEASALISEGIGALRNETELQEALQLCSQTALGGNWANILKQYLIENPTSVLASNALSGMGVQEQSHAHIDIVPAAPAKTPAIEVVPAAAARPEPVPPAHIDVVPAAAAAPAPVEIEIVPPAEPVPAAIEEEIPVETTALVEETEVDEDVPVEIDDSSEIEETVEAPADEEQAIEEAPSEETGERTIGGIKVKKRKDAADIFLLAEGEAVNAAERVPEKSDQLSALYVAIGVHVLMVIVLAFWFISDPPKSVPQIVTRIMGNEEEQTIKKQEKRTVNESPTSTINAMKVVSSFNSSDFAMPSMDDDSLMAGPVGVGIGLGPSMSFGSKGGGAVTFFGSRATAKKIVFVVDVSASMKKAGSSGKRRFDLMKEELKKSILGLPSGVSYQLIFFNGPAWFAGQSIDKGNWHEKNARNFWSYKTDNDSELPRASMMSVRPNKIQKTIQHIDEVRMDYGTDWRSPLKMAMNLEPDLIFFMTDGEVFENPDKTPLVKDLLEYNLSKSKATINCISLMEIGAYKMMNELAEKTKGEISLVLEDSKVLKGFPLKAYVKKNQ